MRIALTGPMFSGKTTLANYLQDNHGYVWVNYTDYLKTLAVRALQSIGLSARVEDILTNKPTYRPFLQELGTVVGYDQGSYVLDCLNEACAGYPLPDDVVFDNVRFATQYAKLQPLDFRLVRLAIDPATRGSRGVVVSDDHYAEQGVPTQPGELVLDARLPTVELAAQLLLPPLTFTK